MRLSKKQQTIVEIVKDQGSLEKYSLFEALEGVIEDKKTYRSRYNSFTQILKRLVEKGELEWQGEHLVLASAVTQNKLKLTEATLKALMQLREHQQPLTLANLKKWTDIRDWMWGLAQAKLNLSFQESRIIDLDAVLDENPETIETLLNHLPVDVQKIMASGLIFGPNHHQQLQREAHTRFCQKIIKFSIPHQTLKTTIEAKLPQQSSRKTISELLESVVLLTKEELQEIAKKFETPYLQKTASQRLFQMFESEQSFETQLKSRFPEFFTGSWEWDRLYQQLNQKISKHAKDHGLYHTSEEWKQLLKKQARDRFQQAQQTPSFREPDAKQKPQCPQPPTLKGCYQLLGLSQTTNVEEIKIAFRKLAKAHHPDQGGNPEFFRSLSQAYTRLISHLEN